MWCCWLGASRAHLETGVQLLIYLLHHRLQLISSLATRSIFSPTRSSPVMESNIQKNKLVNRKIFWLIYKSLKMFGKDFKTLMRNWEQRAFVFTAVKPSDGGELEGSPPGDLAPDHGESSCQRPLQYFSGQQRTSRHQFHSQALEISEDKKNQI